MAKKLGDSGPAGSVLGGNVSPDTLVGLVMEDARLKRAVDEANGKFRAHRSKMEKQGVNLKVLADLTRLSKLDDGERLAHLQTMFRYAGILELSVGEQAELFPDAAVREKPGEKVSEQKRLWAAEQAGYDAATQGGERTLNPYEPGSPNFAAWTTGFDKGREFMQGRAEIAPPKERKKKGAGEAREVSARRGGGRRAPRANGSAAASA